MLLTLLAIVFVFLASMALFHIADNLVSKTVANLFGFTGTIGMMATFILLVFYAISIYAWIGAGHKADFINSEFGTSYSREQIFWAGDVIEEIREIKRQRIEINGDLMKKTD